MMNLIIWLLLGLIAGLLARFFFPGPVPMSLGLTILLGLAGSLVGGFLGDLAAGRRKQGLHPAGLVGSVIGAIVVIIVFRALD